MSERVTLVGGEVLSANDPSARATIVAADVLHGGDSNARITTGAMEVAYQGSPKGRVTTQAAEVLHSGNPRSRVTMAGLEVIRSIGGARTVAEGSHRAWRIRRLIGSNSCWNASKITLHDGSGEDLAYGYGGVAFADSIYNGDYQPSKAFDNDPASFWHNSCPGNISHIGWDFGSEQQSWQRVTRITFRNRPDGEYRQDARSVAIEWSDDMTNWTQAWAVEEMPTWGSGETREWRNPNTTTVPTIPIRRRAIIPF